jgi:chromosome segregation ATPase
LKPTKGVSRSLKSKKYFFKRTKREYKDKAEQLESKKHDIEEDRNKIASLKGGKTQGADLKKLIEGRRQALDKEISNIDFALNAKKVNRAELEGEEESGVDRVKKFQSKIDKRKKEIAETDQDMQRHNIDKETHEASLRQARNKKDDLETKITVTDKELNAAKAEERSAINTEAEIRGKIDEEKNRIASLEGNKGLCMDQIKKIQDDPDMSWVI